VKRLITLDPADCRETRSLPLQAPVAVLPSASLLETLNRFQEGCVLPARLWSSQDLSL
jgi:hypothetical protein